MFARFKTCGFAASLAALAAGAGLFALTAAPSPAAARVFVGVGLGFPGFYYPPYPYYPYYAYPPPAWYPPPPADYYPPPAGSWDAPAAPPARAQSWNAPAPPPPSDISYTNKPGWTDAAGRPCREYRTNQMINGRPTAVYGAACEDPDGQWRVVN